MLESIQGIIWAKLSGRLNGLIHAINAQTLEKSWAGNDQERKDLKPTHACCSKKLDGVGPIDNRPSIDKLCQLGHVTDTM